MQVRKTTSEIISATEAAIRASFDVAKAKAVLLQPPPQPRAGRTPGQVVVDLMKAQAVPLPEIQAERWAEEFRAAVAKHTATIEALNQEGADLMSVVKFFRDQGQLSPTLPTELRSAAVTIKESADPTVPLGIARRIELGISDTVNECRRLKNYAAKCISAAEVVIAKQSIEFYEKCGPRYAAEVAEHQKALEKAQLQNRAIKVKPGRAYEGIES
jgi:hypothetical protein